MKKQILMLLLLTFLSVQARAGATFDMVSIAKSITDIVNIKTKQAADAIASVKQQLQLENEGEAADMQPQEQAASTTTIPVEESLLIASGDIAAELAKESPQVANIETILRNDYYYKNESLFKDATTTFTENAVYQPKKNSLELVQIQSHYTFELARALALKANLMAKNETEESENMLKYAYSLNNTADLRKYMSTLQYKISSLLNEISVMRNAALQIQSINNLHGYTGKFNETNENSSITDIVSDSIPL